jgi:hypothetical protein
MVALALATHTSLYPALLLPPLLLVLSRVLDSKRSAASAVRDIVVLVATYAGIGALETAVLGGTQWARATLGVMYVEEGGDSQAKLTGPKTHSVRPDAQRRDVVVLLH